MMLLFFFLQYMYSLGFLGCFFFFVHLFFMLQLENTVDYNTACRILQQIIPYGKVQLDLQHVWAKHENKRRHDGE